MIEDIQFENSKKSDDTFHTNLRLKTIHLYYVKLDVRPNPACRGHYIGGSGEREA